MELRQLTTEREREVFSKCVEEARATRGNRFRETARSQLGSAHLAFGTLYALFENEGEPPEKMIAGFRVNDLATLPQSFPKPDLSHLPPQSVLEAGELWSLRHGAGRVACIAIGAVIGLWQARVTLIYGIAKPKDLCTEYERLGFVKVGRPILWPFAETVDKGQIWVQAMTVEGEKLVRYIRSGYEMLFGASENCRAVRFANPFPQQPQSSPVLLRPEGDISAAKTGISNGHGAPA
jgi:hypothetical protein